MKNIRSDPDSKGPKGIVRLTSVAPATYETLSAHWVGGESMSRNFGRPLDPLRLGNRAAVEKKAAEEKRRQEEEKAAEEKRQAELLKELEALQSSGPEIGRRLGYEYDAAWRDTQGDLWISFELARPGTAGWRAKKYLPSWGELSGQYRRGWYVRAKIKDIPSTSVTPLPERSTRVVVIPGASTPVVGETTMASALRKAGLIK